jgi:hypothetical protein
MRATLMRDTPMRDTAMRTTSMRCTSMRATPMRATSEMHAHEALAYERHAHEIHAHDQMVVGLECLDTDSFQLCLQLTEVYRSWANAEEGSESTLCLWTEYRQARVWINVVFLVRHRAAIAVVEAFLRICRLVDLVALLR